MDTQEMSPNLAQVACSLTNQSHSGACPEVSKATFETMALESLEPDELAALKAFLSGNYPLKRLLSNSDQPLIENNWWGKQARLHLIPKQSGNGWPTSGRRKISTLLTGRR